MLAKWKTILKGVMPKPLLIRLRQARRALRDLRACMCFVLDGNVKASFRERLRIVKQLYVISLAIDSPHTQTEILAFIYIILSLPDHDQDGVVEAGCYKGSSTAKFSLACDIAGRSLIVFDSFKGIPNDEPEQRNIFGNPASFKKGDYCGTLDEVKRNVSRYGEIGCCRFVEGWFEETLPRFHEPISAIYLDVDLASSTRMCLKYLYPLLKPGRVLLSQDGHLPLVIAVFDDDSFWLNEIGCKKPKILGLNKSRLIRIVKEV